MSKDASPKGQRAKQPHVTRLRGEAQLSRLLASAKVYSVGVTCPSLAKLLATDLSSKSSAAVHKTHAPNGPCRQLVAPSDGPREKLQRKIISLSRKVCLLSKCHE